MPKFRKVLVAAAALVPAATLGVVTGTVLPASAAPLEHCAVSATVTFAAPGLSVVGTAGQNKNSTSTVSGSTLSGGGDCTGTGVPPLTINTKDAKCKGAGLPAGSACTAVGQFYYDQFGQFATAGPASIAKSVKKLTATFGANVYFLKKFSASEVVGGACGSGVGFMLTGQVNKPKPDKGLPATILACLGSDTGPGTTGSFGADFGQPGLTIATAAIDPATSYIQIG